METERRPWSVGVPHSRNGQIAYGGTEAIDTWAPSAILVGDGLIALGFEALATSAHPAAAPAVRDLAAALRRMGRGQDLDLRLAERKSVGPEECLAMLTEKAGLQLGLAFQLVDDVLDLWGDPRLTGRPAGSDLRSRKHSAPVVAALEAGGAASERLAERYAAPASAVTDAEVVELTELVEAAGGREWARAETRRCSEVAHEELDGLDLDPVAGARLHGLADALLMRAA